MCQNSGGPLDSQTWQTEWRTAPLAKVQSWEYVNQTLQAFDCGQPFVHQVWLFSGRPEFFTCSYCAWLWNWLINLTSSNLLFLRFARKLSGKNYFPFDLLIITATRTKLWKLLLRAAICIPSLIVQRSARMFHFSSLRMIVKLAFVRFKDLSLKCEKWTGFWQL